MRRIFMVSSQPLFSRGIEELLLQQPGFEIVGREHDLDRAIRSIHDLCPDVVILDSQNLASTPADAVAAVLKEAPQARVISLNLENDKILVYHGEQRSAQSIDDLREVVDAEWSRSTDITPPEWLALAAGRVQVYGFLAASVNQPVGDDLIETVTASSRSMLGSLERDVDLTGDLGEGLQALERFQAAVRQQDPAAVGAALRNEFGLLFRQSTGQPGGPYESAYAGGEAPVWTAARAGVGAVYDQFDFCPPDCWSDRPDFIGCELAFMHHLCRRECDAWMVGNHPEAFRLQAAECVFLKEHLVRWIPRCCDALLARACLDFYRGILFLTRGFILNEAYRVAQLMECAGPAERLPPGGRAT